MFEAVVWSRAQLAVGINLLAKQVNNNILDKCHHGQTVEQLAHLHGIEAVPTQSTYGDLAHTLKQLVPGIIELQQEGQPTYLLVNARRGRYLQLMAPTGGYYFYTIDKVVGALRDNRQIFPPQGADSVLHELGLAGKRLARARDLLIQQQLGSHPITQLWLLRPHPSRGLRVMARYARLGHYALGFAIAHLFERLMLIMGIGVLGYAITQGLWNFALIFTWLLIMCTHWGFSALGKTCQLQLNVRTGIIIKRQLQYAALYLPPEVLADKGPAQLLGQSLEAESLHNNALTGLFAAINAIIDIFIAVVIALLIGNWFIGLLLGIFIVASSCLIAKFTEAYDFWAKQRVTLSHLTIEHIQGNRTRLIQSTPECWHKEEECCLHNYWQASVKMDRFAFWLQAVIPGLWLIAGSAVLCFSIFFTSTPLVKLASTLGVVLLVWQAWHSIADSSQQLARTWHSLKQVLALLAQAKPCLSVPQMELGVTEQHVPTVLEANQLSYGYNSTHTVIHNLSINLKHGRRYLLQGESGSGKSTLFSLLSGQILQQEGSLLLNSFDIKDWGYEHWRKKICWVPQFHENYIFSGSLLYNLMLGRHWPPTQQDVEEALDVCESLGLFPLIRKMPARLLQPIGEMGWQLSHGEASRIYLARALLQNPDFLLVDESLGALDVNTSKQILAYLKSSTPAVVLCMHP